MVDSKKPLIIWTFSFLNQFIKNDIKTKRKNENELISLDLKYLYDFPKKIINNFNYFFYLLKCCIQFNYLIIN